jgi:hypothetical protein
MRLISAELAANGEKLDYKHYKLEEAPHVSCLKSFGGHKTIEQFRQQHCQQVRLVCLPQSLHFTPVGFNIFELPRDDGKLFAEIRPQSAVKSSCVPVKTQKKVVRRKSQPKARAGPNGVQLKPRVIHKKNKSIEQLIYEDKKRKRAPKPYVSNKKKVKVSPCKNSPYKMSRATPRIQTSIGAMMGIKFK